MLSTLLLRLIKEAILPAVVVFLAKILAVFFLIQWLNIMWKVDTQSIFPGITFDDPAITIFVNSYSNLFAYIVSAIGLGFVIAQAYHFHDTHMTPNTVLNLLSLNLSGLIVSTKEIYIRGMVWLSYIWLLTLLIAFHTLLNTNFIWIFFLSLIVSVYLSWLLISDVEREVNLI